MRRGWMLLATAGLLGTLGWLAVMASLRQERPVVATAERAEIPAIDGGVPARRQGRVSAPTAVAATRPAARPDTKAAAHQAVALLDAQLAREATDAQWERTVDAQVRDLLRSPAGHGARLIALACRTSLCRVELAHDDGDGQDGFLERLTFTPPFDSEGLVRRVGEHQTVVYFARAGRRLPRLGE